MKTRHLVLAISLVALAACASGPETVTVEKKKGTTIIHHRSKTSSGSRDRIEAINSSGAYSQAEVHVYDVGRTVDASGNVQEAHRVYRIVQSERPNLALPRKVTGGPRTAYTPPNYTPPPNDQRIKDAVEEANKAKAKMDAATKQMQEHVQEDNNLRGELQTQIDENQRLRDQLNAGMNTPKHGPATAQTDAEKAAQAAINAIQ